MIRIPVEIEWTSAAGESLRKIGSRTIQQKIRDKVTQLAASGDPELLGKPLVDEFHGLYRISFARYRIVYRVIRHSKSRVVVRIVVRVLLAAIRKHGDKSDIYEQLRRMLRRGEL